MTPASKHDFWVMLEDEHAKEWEPVLGPERARHLPVTTPVPLLAELPGYEMPQRVFLLAVDVMPPDAVAAIAAKLAAKFGLSPEEAADEVRKAGIPIREEHTVCLTVHRPQRWF